MRDRWSRRLLGGVRIGVLPLPIYAVLVTLFFVLRLVDHDITTLIAALAMVAAGSFTLAEIGKRIRSSETSGSIRSSS
jgi:Na+/citrate or Na+/malate symporter